MRKFTLFIPCILLFVSLTHGQSTAEKNNENDANTVSESAEDVVQRQVEAYNARDIDAFMATYSDDIELYRFPQQLFVKGQKEMRNRYATMFDATPNLYCEIKNRIVLGNKIIDKEYVRKNDDYINAIAIYEVTNGKISKVTFIK